MDVSIDSNICQGHGSCTIICGTVFDLADDGYGKVLEPHPDESLRGTVEEAVANCPEQAITVTG
jgi:ferredoxin